MLTTRTKISRIIRENKIVLVLVLLVFVFFWKVVFLGYHFVPGDISEQWYPWIVYNPNLGKNASVAERINSVHNAALADTSHYIYPYRFYFSKAMRDGIFPLWNPFVSAGAPFFALPLPSLFDPFSILLFILPTGLALGYIAIIQVFLAGLFMYLFLRTIKLDKFSSVIGAIIFMFSGFFTVNLWFLGTALWFPLIFLLFEKSLEKKSYFFAILTGVIIGIQFFTGHQQISYYMLVAIGLYFLFREFILYREERKLTKLVQPFYFIFIALSVGFLLAAVQLIPSYEFSQLTDRVSNTYKDVAEVTPPFYQIARFVIPNIFGNDITHTYWGTHNYILGNTAYIGLLPSIIAFIAILFRRDKHTLFFSGLALFSLLAAFTPFRMLLFYVLPLFNIFTFPHRIMVLFVFSSSILAALGINFLITTRLKKKNYRTISRINKILILTVIFTIIAIILVFLFKPYILLLGNKIIQDRIQKGIFFEFNPEFYQQRVNLIYAFEIKTLAIFLSLLIPSALLILLFSKKPIKLKLFKSFLFLIIVIDLFSFGINIDTKMKPNSYFSATPSIEFLQKDKEIYRILNFEPNRVMPDDTLFPTNTPMIYGIQTVHGYAPFVIKDYQDFIKLIDPVMIPFAKKVSNLQNPDALKSKLIDFLNVKYILSIEEIENEKLELVFNKDINIYLNKGYLSRAFIVHKIKIMLDRGRILELLGSKTFDPKEYAVLEENPAMVLDDVNEDKSVIQIADYTPNKITITATMPNNGFLVLSDTYYPGWKAFVDGKETKVYKANYAFRAIYVPKGSHNVEFVFKPKSFRIGLGITIIILFLVSLILIFLKIKYRKIK